MSHGLLAEKVWLTVNTHKNRDNWFPRTKFGKISAPVVARFPFLEMWLYCTGLTEVGLGPHCVGLNIHITLALRPRPMPKPLY